MQKHHTVESTERLLSHAIASCPSSARLYQSLKSLRSPLSHLSQLTDLDVEAWQATLNELGNFADDVVALLSRCNPKDEESDQRLKELHASAVNHELDLDARGFLTAFHPSHTHAAHIRNLSAWANVPPDSIKQIFHSLPNLLTCAETLITLPVSSNSIENAVKTALKASAIDEVFPLPDTIVPALDFSRYTSLRTSMQEYTHSLQRSEKSSPHSHRLMKFLRDLMDPGVLQEKRLRLYPPLKPFQIPSEVGRSLRTTVYKANTSVYDGDKQLWITKIALKAYPINQTAETLCSQFHQEALRMRTLSHPCLPAFYGYHWPSPDNQSSSHDSDFDNRPSPRVLLATELMTTDLFQARSLPALRSFAVRLRVLRDIADAVDYLHERGLHHGRLNPRNILLRMSKETVYGRVKVDVTSIVGRVLLRETLDQTPVSCILYLAPESLTPGPKYFTGDVWSLGMLGCFLMIDRQEFFSQLYDGMFARLASGLSLHEQAAALSASISEERIRAVVEICLHLNPSKRSDSRSVLLSLNSILADISEAEGYSKPDYTEEVVDGSVVDEIIDSGAVDTEPSFANHNLREEQSLEFGACQHELRTLFSSTDTPNSVRDVVRYGSQVEEENDERAGKQFPHQTALAPKLRQHSDLQTVIPEVVEGDNGSKVSDNPSDLFVLGQNLETGCGVDRDVEKAIDLYRTAHQKGHLRATFRLAQCYMTASGVNKSLPTATHLLRSAAERGHSLAMVELGRLHETGRGVRESHSMSADWFRRAAHSGSVEGLRCYAKCLLEGFGVKQNMDQAVNLLTEALKRGDGAAGFELGICMRDGLGAQKNATRACELFRWAAEQGHAEAQWEFANCLYDGIGTDRDLISAFEMYKRSADQGHMDARQHLGECYELGHGVKKNIKKAVECFIKASNAGNASAMSSLAGCYERGEGVDHDMKKAIQLYKRAERKNDYLALNNLGVLFERGVHVKQDYDKAVKYYKKAKEQGFIEAACNLADCYLNGNGVRRDIRRAIDLYREAAMEGHAGAKCELGNFYYRGRGIPKDYNRAVQFFREACEAEPEALRLLGVAYFAGNGVNRNIDEAVKLFALAAQEGNSEANLNLGLCFIEGWGVSKSLSRAVSLLALAGDGGSKEAKLILGNMYYEGRGVQRDIRKAVELFCEGENLDLDMI